MQISEFGDIVISSGAKILEAMKNLDKTGKKIVFVLEDGTLRASLTDGDIRRHILRGGSPEDSVLAAANMEPKTVSPEKVDEAEEIMEKFGIDTLPVVDKEGRMVSVKYLYGQTTKCSEPVDLPVIIMAGGRGTRLYPYTKILPKPLIPIGDRPILEYIIDRFRGCGCRDFYLVLNHKKNMVKSYFNDIEKEYDLHYIDEDKPLGTGGGLSLLKGMPQKTAFVSNCDILIDANYTDIVNFHKANGNLITMVCAFKHITVPYGVIKAGESGVILSMEEKPEFSFMVNTGMYVIEPRVINEMPQDTEVGFPDIVEKYRRAGEKVAVYPINEKDWMDMGQIEELEEMRNRMGV